MSESRTLRDVDERFNELRGVIQSHGREIERLEVRIERGERRMADYATDVTRLTADVTAETAIIAQVVTYVTANTASIAALNTEIATLKAQAINTAGLEAALTAFETNNTAIGAAIAPPSPPTPPAV